MLGVFSRYIYNKHNRSIKWLVIMSQETDVVKDKYEMEGKI